MYQFSVRSGRNTSLPVSASVLLGVFFHEVPPRHHPSQSIAASVYARFDCE